MSVGPVAPLLLMARVYVGWIWLNVGWGLVQSASWMDEGAAFRQALLRTRVGEEWMTAGQGWRSDAAVFLVESRSIDWIARITAIGLTMVGIAMILGLATAIAAVAGLVLAGNAVVAGSVAIDPVVVGLALVLLVRSRSAGAIGLDRWVRPAAQHTWNRIVRRWQPGQQLDLNGPGDMSRLSHKTFANEQEVAP